MGMQLKEGFGSNVGVAELRDKLGTNFKGAGC
jgi:hypothetical protein